MKIELDEKTIIEKVNEVFVKLDEDGGLKRVYLLACGGSHANLAPVNYLLNEEALTIRCENINAMEFADATPKACDKNALCIGLSLGGNTFETVNALKKAKECGAKIITVGGVEKCGIAEYSDCHFVSGIDQVTYGHVGLVTRIGFEILNHFEGYKNYEDVRDAYTKINKVAAEAKKKAKKQGQKWAEKYKDIDTIYTLASGNLYEQAYETSICFMMEMQWINTNAIHSGEYFHGPFEVTSEHTPFVVLESLGKTRALDERALKFLNKYCKDVEVYDAKEYGIDKLGSAAEYLQPIIFGEIVMTIMLESMKARNHPIFRRRYMFREEY